MHILFYQSFLTDFQFARFVQNSHFLIVLSGQETKEEFRLRKEKNGLEAFVKLNDFFQFLSV